MANRGLIQMNDVHKAYRMGRTRVHALAGVDFEVESGEMVAIMGPSGAGKSTMLNIVGCLDRPTSGEYWLDNEAVARMGNDQLAGIRGRKIGFVFQTFSLLARTNALQNVMLPLLYTGTRGRRKLAAKALDRVGMADRMDHNPNELSAGQQQRVAVARALVTEPAILLADEPTGNLDSKTGAEIMRLFWDLNEEGVTVVLVTHDDEIGECARRIVRMRDGRIVDDRPAPHVYPMADQVAEPEPEGGSEVAGGTADSGSASPRSNASSTGEKSSCS